MTPFRCALEQEHGDVYPWLVFRGALCTSAAEALDAAHQAPWEQPWQAFGHVSPSLLRRGARRYSERAKLYAWASDTMVSHADFRVFLRGALAPQKSDHLWKLGSLDVSVLNPQPEIVPE